MQWLKLIVILLFIGINFVIWGTILLVKLHRIHTDSIKACTSLLSQNRVYFTEVSKRLVDFDLVFKKLSKLESKIDAVTKRIDGLSEENRSSSSPKSDLREEALKAITK